MAELEIASPLSGWVWPLTETPDPAFAQGQIGPGVAVDPVVGEVRAPFDGVVATLNPSRHAVVIRHAGGVEVLVHVGIDTVALAGRGFEALTAAGRSVRAGDLLLRFDLDRVARAAASLVSPVVVTSPEGVTLQACAVARAIGFGETLFRVRSPEMAAGTRASPAERTARTVVIGLAHGLHARPAAALARRARERGVSGRLVAGDATASLGGVAALMALNLKAGDRVRLEATGALEELAALLEGDFHETPAARSAPAVARSATPVTPGRLQGVCGAPGRAVGPLFVLRPAEIIAPDAEADPSAEAQRLDAGLAAAAAALPTVAPGAAAEVAEAHRGLIADADLRRLAHAAIARGRSAGQGWVEAVDSFVDRFRSSGDPRLAERVSDLLDVRRQVLVQLYGDAGPGPKPPEGAVVLAEDLFPSQLADLAAARVAGVCLARSGPTAHVAIIAAALGLPLVAAAGPWGEDAADGVLAVLDADRGELVLAPPPDAVAAARAEVAARHARAAADRDAALGPAVTRDGVRIEVFANLGAAGEAAPAVALGAEGCGLLRTEVLFMDRPEAPDAEAQRAACQAVLDGLGGAPLTLRTLDAGGDKPLAYLPNRHEANPALGLRGVRTSLAHPELLRAQLQAVVRLRPLSAVSVMLPMVTGLDELRRVRLVLDAAVAEAGVETPPPLGLMIETPAAALLAEPLAREADFLSIGSNDLAQYVLAMDRTHPDLAASADALHPAVLRAIALTLEGARRHGRKVSVCGGLASDLTAAPLLIGLGVTRLSCTPAAIPAIKALIRTLDRSSWEATAQTALSLDDAPSVRALVRRHVTAAANLSAGERLA